MYRILCCYTCGLCKSENLLKFTSNLSGQSSHCAIRLDHISPRILETVCRHIEKTLAATPPPFLLRLRLRLHPLKGHFALGGNFVRLTACFLSETMKEHVALSKFRTWMCCLQFYSKLI